MPSKRKDTGKWQARIWVNRKPIYGGSYDRRKDAVEAENELRAKHLKRPKVEETCESFADRWLKDYRRPSQTTMRTYRYGLIAFKQEFGARKLHDIEPQEARIWALTQPKKNVEIVRAMFNDARIEGLVRENPFSNLRLPGPSRAETRVKRAPVTEEELHKLADTALEVHGEYGPTFRAFILFQAYVGLRPGETCALEWDAINGDEINVDWQINSLGEKTRPKNKQPRTVLLPPPAQEALHSFPRRLDTERVFYSKGREGDRATRPLNKSSYTNYWQDVRIKAEYPKLALYSMRHYCATYLLELGLLPSDVAVQLGHTDGGVLVQRTYGHSERSARDRLRAAFVAPTSLNAVREAKSQGA